MNRFLMLLVLGLVLPCTVMIGCRTTDEKPVTEADATSPYTHGNVQLTLVRGETTQAEVLEVFGAPNVATIDGSGNEVWTYQKHAVVKESRQAGAYATIFVAGVGGNSSGFSSSSRTMTLIIKFDANKRVSDFKSKSTSF